MRKGAETWTQWDKRLAPSTELFDAFYGRKRLGRKVVARDLQPIPFADYRRIFLREMKRLEPQAALAALRSRSKGGETITLLCFCVDEAHCHRSIVLDLLRSLKT